ncbi:MAG TPA: hypothetical protein VJ110_01895 [Candidatus Nanoarchaeia archaeon]|nr:hypothetical protein [Candidatus Nanoarchaeia archaeon]
MKQITTNTNKEKSLMPSASSRAAITLRLTPVNRKGVEQPQVIIYTLFVVILTLSGIYVGFTFLGGIDVTLDFQDYASRLNTASSRMIFSPQCFAQEMQYTKGGTFHQVNSGIIDWVKFNATTVIQSSCLANEVAWAKLESVDTGKFEKIVWSCGALPRCDVPAADQLNSQWRQAPRSFYVLVDVDGNLDRGILTVRLKE